MDEEKPRHKIQGKRHGWWPKDRNGLEIDTGDFLLFTSWVGYPMPVFGQVTRIGKTGKVHARTVRIHAKDKVEDIEIKECSYTLKLSPTLVQAILMEKLAHGG